MNYLFLDTNIFLHFKPVKDIQWESYLSGEFRVALAPVVLDELDEKKFDSRAKIKDRAKKSLKKFDEAITTDDESFFCFSVEDAFSQDYSQYSLNALVQDDRLIISILKFIATHPRDNSYLVTHDIGPRLKAKRFKIPVLSLPEKELIPGEVDEYERENKQLRVDIQRLQNRQPKLSLRFENGQERMTFNLAEANVTQPDEEITRQILPVIEIDNYKDYALSIPQMVTQYYGSYINIENYNESVNYYNKLMDGYEEARKIIMDWECRSLLFNSFLLNEGTMPAEGLEVTLRFPENISIIPVGDRPVCPRKPTAPVFEKFPTPGAYFRQVGGAIHEERNSRIEYLRNLDSSLMNRKKMIYNVPVLKHTKQREIGPLWMTFAKDTKIQNFKIEFELHANNLPVPVIGDLHVLIHKNI